MLFALLGAGVALAKATSVNIESVFKKAPATIVVFERSGKKCVDCPKVNSAVERAAKGHVKAVQAVRVDTDEATDLAARYNIRFVPQILLFRQGELKRVYMDEFSEDAIGKFVSKVVDAKVKLLNNSFDVFEFQNARPMNVILAGAAYRDKAQRLLSRYGGVLEIGLVEDNEVVRELGLSAVTFTRPDEKFVQGYPTFDDQEINKLLFPRFVHVNNTNMFGLSLKPVCLTALLDTRDPLQVQQMMVQFREAHKAVGDEIGYQYCDFFTCKQFADAVKLDQVTAPFYILQRAGAERPLRPLKKWIRKPNDVALWLREELYGEKQVVQDVDNGIEKLRAADFQQKVLNPKIDAIMFVASPDMDGYQEALANAQLLVKLFADIPTVKIYELDQQREYIEGLQIPGDGRPVFSVWKASEEPSGSAFSAELQIPIILDGLLQIITTEISDEKLEKMVEMVQKHMMLNAPM